MTPDLINSPLVVWVTGLSGSGKTTLCNAVHELLKPILPELVVFDGDGVRQVLSQDLGYTEEERIIQFKRMHAIVKLVASQGIFVIVGGLYLNPELSAWNRKDLPGYFEVYLKASLETVRRRDTKNLYAKADAGEMTDVVGLDIPWHAPERPDMVFDMDVPQDPETMARLLIDGVPRLSQAMNVAPDTEQPAFQAT